MKYLNKLQRAYQRFYYELCKRHAYALTGPLRVLPDLIVIGVGRGGTTSLYHYLKQHKCIVPSAYDEIGFFDDNYHLGLNWYRSMFPTKFTKNKILKKYGKFVTYEVTPWYIRRPWVANRIHTLLPNVKLIAVLRNPVDRAYSHYYLAKKSGNVTLPFEQIIIDDLNRLVSIEKNGLSYNDEYFRTIVQNSYLARGLYAQQLKNWFEVFPREQILIISSEDLSLRTQTTLNAIFKFLNIPLQNIQDLEKINVGNYPPMEEKLRTRLLEFYSEHNEELFTILNYRFDWSK